VPGVSRLVTDPTDPFTTFTSTTGPLLSEWVKCQPGNTQNGRTVLPIANLIADSESRSPVSYSSFLVTIHLPLLVLEIFSCDRQTPRTITTAGPHIVAGQLTKHIHEQLHIFIHTQITGSKNNKRQHMEKLSLTTTHDFDAGANNMKPK